MKNSVSISFFLWAILSLLLIYLVNPGATWASPAKNKHEIIFGILPIVSTANLVKRFAPLAEYLSEEVGVTVRMETATNFKTFMTRTNKGRRYDLLFTAPHFYYLAQRRAGYQVIVSVAAPNMKALIVVPKKSEVKTLDDLKGLTLSTTDSLSLAALMVRAHLVAAGINPDKDIKLINTPSHNASLLSVYKGITDAGSLMQPPFRRANKEIAQSLRVLSTTDGSPHMPIAVSPEMSPDLQNKIKNALLRLKENKNGRVILKNMRWPGFKAVKPKDYDKLKWAVEQLK